MADEPDYTLAELLPVSEISDHLPRRPNGEKVSTSTIYSWLGLNRTDGRVLRSVLIGRHRYTCERWLRAFIDGDGPVLAPAPRRSPAKRQREFTKAMAVLEKAGI